MGSRVNPANAQHESPTRKRIEILNTKAYYLFGFQAERTRVSEFRQSSSPFANRFLDWVNDARLEEKTRKFYRNGWRLLKATPVADVRVNEITADRAEKLNFPGSTANANCALRTLRRMLHKAEEWKMIGTLQKSK